MIESFAKSAPLDRGGEALPARASLGLTTACTSAGTALYLLAPASAPFVLPLCLAVPLIWYQHTHGDLHNILQFRSTAVTLAVGACYALINANWSPARAEAYRFAAMLLIVAVCTPVTIGTLLRLGHRRAIHAMAIGFYGAFAAVGAFLCFEILSQAAVHSRLVAAIPTLWPNESHDLVSLGGLPNYFLNHKMAGLAALFWPALLTAMYLVSGCARLLLLCGLVPAVISIAASEHQTSMVALLLSGVAYVGFKIAARAAHRILLASWAAACFAVVPLCLAAYAANLHHARWLQVSAQHRIVIWKATSDRVVDAPMFGSGIHASRAISRREPPPSLAPGTQYRLSVSWHSHNAFLQVWFEAGAVGAVILWIFGMLVMRSIRRETAPAEAALFATFTSCALLAATGYSAFAPWLSASFALAAIFASLGVATSLCRPMRSVTERRWATTTDLGHVG